MFLFCLVRWGMKRAAFFFLNGKVQKSTCPEDNKLLIQLTQVKNYTSLFHSPKKKSSLTELKEEENLFKNAAWPNGPWLMGRQQPGGIYWFTNAKSLEWFCCLWQLAFSIGRLYLYTCVICIFIYIGCCLRSEFHNSVYKLCTVLMLECQWHEMVELVWVKL